MSLANEQLGSPVTVAGSPLPVCTGHWSSCLRVQAECLAVCVPNRVFHTLWVHTKHFLSEWRRKNTYCCSKIGVYIILQGQFNSAPAIYSSVSNQRLPDLLESLWPLGKAWLREAVMLLWAPSSVTRGQCTSQTPYSWL